MIAANETRLLWICVVYDPNVAISFLVPSILYIYRENLCF